MSGIGAAKVWDLADSSIAHGRAARRRDVGGPLATALGAVALGSAVLPGLDLGTRWLLVSVAGSAGVFVAASALRRPRSTLSMVLVVLGLLAPAGSAVAMVQVASAGAHAVTNATVADTALRAERDAMTRSRRFADLPGGERAAATRLAADLVLRLRSLHGSWGPYPGRLALSQGSIVEADGALRGTPVGTAVPTGRVLYQVSASRTAFRVTVVSTEHPGAAVSADSALTVPGG